MFTHSVPSDHDARASHWHSRIEANHPDFHSSRRGARSSEHPLTPSPQHPLFPQHPATFLQSRCTGSVDVMLPFCCMLCNALFNVRVCWHIKARQVFVIFDDDARGGRYANAWKGLDAQAWWYKNFITRGLKVRFWLLSIHHQYCSELPSRQKRRRPKIIGKPRITSFPMREKLTLITPCWWKIVDKDKKIKHAEKMALSYWKDIRSQ